MYNQTKNKSTDALEAFGVFVNRHDPRVTSLVARLLGQGSLESDVDATVQEIFLQAWQIFSGSKMDTAGSIWLYRIAAARAVKQWRTLKRQPQMVFDEELPVSVRDALTSLMPGPANAATLRARDKDLYAAIDRLPEQPRAVILLHYFEDYSCEDVAQILDCSVSAVWAHLHDACRKLHEATAWLRE